MEVVKPEEKTEAAKLPQPAPIRLSRTAKKQLNGLLEELNSKDFGRRIKASEVISMSLSLLTAEHIRELKDQSLTNLDRLELLYQQHSNSNPDLTKDELIGMLLQGSICSSAQKPKAKRRSSKTAKPEFETSTLRSACSASE